MDRLVPVTQVNCLLAGISRGDIFIVTARCSRRGMGSSETGGGVTGHLRRREFRPEINGLGGNNRLPRLRILVGKRKLRAIVDTATSLSFARPDALPPDAHEDVQDPKLLHLGLPWIREEEEIIDLMKRTSCGSNRTDDDTALWLSAGVSGSHQSLSSSQRRSSRASRST